jgi:hypothetical protein
MPNYSYNYFRSKPLGTPFKLLKWNWKMWILCLFDTGPPMASVLFAMFELPLEMLAKSMSFGWKFEKFLEVSNSTREKTMCNSRCDLGWREWRGFLGLRTMRCVDLSNFNTMSLWFRWNNCRDWEWERMSNDEKS